MDIVCEWAIDHDQFWAALTQNLYAYFVILLTNIVIFSVLCTSKSIQLPLRCGTLRSYSSGRPIYRARFFYEYRLGRCEAVVFFDAVFLLIVFLPAWFTDSSICIISYVFIVLYTMTNKRILMFLFKIRLKKTPNICYHRNFYDVNWGSKSSIE